MDRKSHTWAPLKYNEKNVYWASKALKIDSVTLLYFVDVFFRILVSVGRGVGLYKIQRWFQKWYPKVALVTGIDGRGDTLNRDLHIETSKMEGGGAHGVMVYNVHFYIFP